MAKVEETVVEEPSFSFDDDDAAGGASPTF